jgi:hypothetical protein
MTDISKRLEQTLRSVIQKAPILPVKVAGGILVGNVLITSNGSLKDLWQHDSVVYREVSLNKVAIKLANMLAKHGNSYQTDTIYKADQEYGRWFNESQILRTQYQKALNNQDYDRADMLWARYCESRDKVLSAKARAETLATI